MGVFGDRWGPKALSSRVVGCRRSGVGLLRVNLKPLHLRLVGFRCSVQGRLVLGYKVLSLGFRVVSSGFRFTCNPIVSKIWGYMGRI